LKLYLQFCSSRHREFAGFALRSRRSRLPVDMSFSDTSQIDPLHLRCSQCTPARIYRTPLAVCITMSTSNATSRTTTHDALSPLITNSTLCPFGLKCFMTVNNLSVQATSSTCACSLESTGNGRIHSATAASIVSRACGALYADKSASGIHANWDSAAGSPLSLLFP
jgi:hypothetical protein